MTAPRVSIIIVNWKTPKLLPGVLILLPKIPNTGILKFGLSIMLLAMILSA